MIEKLLELEEGYREYPYLCSEKYPTVGIGKRIGPKGADIELYQFSVSKPIAYAWLNDEIKIIRAELIKHNWYVNLNEDRQAIIKSMAYQLGLSGLFKFKKMIAALESKDWSESAIQALDSKWAKQTPARSKRHAGVLFNGKISSEYEDLL